jgi:glycosyltransferase involved in cell wall biosynthesis
MNMINSKLFNYPLVPQSNTSDLVCFCHLRWNFVYQRPQHLLSRFAKRFRVFFVEEPIFGAEKNHLHVSKPSDNLWVVVPQLRDGLSEEEIYAAKRDLLARFFREMNIIKYLFWYYTPMALQFTRNFKPEAVIYDCMDELSCFKFAPPLLKKLEKELMARADVMFTGGYSLYEAKKDQHRNIYPFPSSIEKEHFAKARKQTKDPADQSNIPHPRFGFYGVIDERFDLELVRRVAEKRPNWHFVIIGPVVKIDPASLPQRSNIHYLGGKSYEQLPEYLAGWDIAFIPFELNESTKYISPTKTPEYLAAGKPVISTSIRDVVSPYGNNGLVHIADTAEDFIRFAELELKSKDKTKWLQKSDEFLANNSWDNTWSKMMHHINQVLHRTPASSVAVKPQAYV